MNRVNLRVTIRVTLRVNLFVFVLSSIAHILSTGVMGFVQLRHEANTWVKENVEFRRNSSTIGSGDIRQYLLEGEKRL